MISTYFVFEVLLFYNKISNRACDDVISPFFAAQKHYHEIVLLPIYLVSIFHLQRNIKENRKICIPYCA